ncbi:MAG TPA: hybrid sensor histidine kinase/response regulator [Polyangiaceae bacterium]|nr:hybrid sensor histidine kinase/response regulator [Polyangiaceae bacterium]
MPLSSAPRSLPPPPPDQEADLAGALHEVSNALTVVLGWLDVAYSRLESGPARDAVDVARTHARLGHGISRSAIGAEAPDSTAQASGRSVAESALTGVRPQADQRRVKLDLQLLDSGSALLGSVGSLLQILTNLLLNAIDFSPEGSTVSLGVREEGGSVIFSVSDQGPGIDPERVATLLSAPVSTRKGGAGVGLRHSAALCRTKGGSLSVARTGPGACFDLRWPIAELRTGTAPKRVKRPTVEGARVLVVEDDEAVRSLVELALQARGAEAKVVANRQQFDAVVAQGAQLDAALVDLSPLAADPAGAFQLLRECHPGIPVILISGVASGVPEELVSEVSAWVRKPFEMGEVLAVLASILEARARA